MQKASNITSKLSSLMQLQYGSKYDMLPQTEDLIATLELDSIALVELISNLESHFAVTFDAEDIVIANFTTLANIETLLERKLQKT